MPDTAESWRRTANALPVALLNEVLDFAEFLSAQHARPVAQQADVSPGVLCGGLADSTKFSDSPVHIQERLRNEWH